MTEEPRNIQMYKVQDKKTGGCRGHTARSNLLLHTAAA